MAKMPMKTPTNKFCIHSQEPDGGITFTKHPIAYDKLAGDTPVYRKSRFGIMDNEPAPDATFIHAGSHIKFPSADVAPKPSKLAHSSPGQGEYDPKTAKGKSSGSEQFPGTGYGVGQSAPKRGSMKPMTKFGK